MAFRERLGELTPPSLRHAGGKGRDRGGRGAPGWTEGAPHLTAAGRQAAVCAVWGREPPARRAQLVLVQSAQGPPRPRCLLRVDFPPPEPPREDPELTPRHAHTPDLYLWNNFL